MDDAAYTMDHLAIGYRHRGQPRILFSGLCGCLRKGELTCLLGENGCGKSTLLRTLAGLQPPLEGKILVQGRNLASFKRSELAQLVSIVLTDPIKNNSLTVTEIVSAGRFPHTGFWGHLGAADRQKVDVALSQVGISSLRSRQAYTLSDGERQKALIAKALSQDTSIILLDEPTCFLDFPSKVEILRLLQRLAHTHHLAILISIHDLELALQIADSLWLIDASHHLHTGRPLELAQSGILDYLFERAGAIFDRQHLSYRIDTAKAPAAQPAVATRLLTQHL